MLTAGNRAERVRFAEQQLAMIAADFTYTNRLVFSDEAHFLLNGHVNHQNYRLWDDHNPHAYEEDELHPDKVTVWAAIGKGGVIIGPIFDPVSEKGTINGDSYLELLKNVLKPDSELRGILGTMIFQQDGAPPHYCKKVLIHLPKSSIAKLINAMLRYATG